MRKLLLVVVIAACGDNVAPPPTPTGSLVEISTAGKVGVLLDDYPAAMRDRVATELIARPQTFWRERVALQLRLTALRLVYRRLYYDEAAMKDALALPPEDVWTVAFNGAARRQTVDGHDLVAIDYAIGSYLLSDVDSPAISEPALGTVGGTWDETFVLPVDPTLLLQRTDYACIDEDQFPADSVDAENAYEFYDDTCDVELPSTVACHITKLPTESCVAAVERAIGKSEVTIHYTRVAWDEAIASTVRTTPPTVDAPDLEVLTSGFQSLANNHVIYKYFAPDHCALAEEPACVGGPGWRRLLAFDSIDKNVGTKPIDIGPVDYYNAGLGGELIDHNVYTLSACHQHFHFLYYGNFGFGTETAQKVQKNGFCLESTGRLSNNEHSPLNTPYNCQYQGVSPGWVDLYAAGLTCNWVDVTSIDTSAAPVTAPLTFHSNPDGFICEGEFTHDDAGNQVWETTTFTSPAGDPVDRPACEEAAGTEGNDLGTLPVTLPIRGGMMSTACTSEHLLGPARNCGFAAEPTPHTCTPGAMTTVTCVGAAATKPQVVRLCETSKQLGGGVDCAFQDALANLVVEGTAATATFECPAARDAIETGGQYAVYTAPVYAPDGSVAISCN